MVAVFVLCIFVGVKNGLIRSVIGLVVVAVSAALVAGLRLPALVITIATGALAASIAAAIGLGTSITLASTGFVGTLLDLRLGVVPEISRLRLRAAAVTPARAD